MTTKLRFVQPWTTPSCYMGEDHTGNYVVHSISLYSGDVPCWNHRRILQILEERFPGAAFTERSSHWASRWIETIMIPSSQEGALEEADELIRSIVEDYPILDEHLYNIWLADRAYQEWEFASLNLRLRTIQITGHNCGCQLSPFVARSNFDCQDWRVRQTWMEELFNE